jgi:two-component system, OmpR family, sensor kinase
MHPHRRHHHHHPFGRLRRYVGHRLHRRIFVWFGASILITGVVLGCVMMLLGPRFGWQRQVEGARSFIAWQFADVWQDSERRDALARRAAQDFDVDLVVEDAERKTLAVYGERCQKMEFTTRVETQGKLLGFVRVCARHAPHRGPLRLFVVLGAAGITLWAVTGVIARRLVRPLGELVRVTEEIGEGKLASRARLDPRAGEIAALGDAINHMAERIERQIGDQRELLAGVSHEIRSPLARMRVLLELCRSGATPERIDEIEKELVEIDALVGELLASARLDFAAMDRKELNARDLASRALERADVDVGVLECAETTLSGDPTLLLRALSNLLENAKRHGNGVTALRVVRDGEKVEFWVEDGGTGFSEEELPRVFDSFVRGERGRRAGGTSLGLGLALVRRIAVAHGGEARAENRDGGGARVGFWVRRTAEA